MRPHRILRQRSLLDVHIFERQLVNKQRAHTPSNDAPLGGAVDIDLDPGVEPSEQLCVAMRLFA